MTQECLSTSPPSNDHRLCLPSLYESIYTTELGCSLGRWGQGTFRRSLSPASHHSTDSYQPQSLWTPFLSCTMRATNQVISKVYKFSCLNLIHNFVHILLFLRDNFNYIQKSEKANESQLLLLLSRFSHVQPCVTPYTAAHQAPPSLGFSRQEYWSGLPFPSLVHESEK